jgi:hypothetical protein
VDLINETVKTEQIWGAMLVSFTSTFIAVSRLREEINVLLNVLISNDFLCLFLYCNLFSVTVSCSECI